MSELISLIHGAHKIKNNNVEMIQNVEMFVVADATKRMRSNLMNIRRNLRTI